MSIYSYNKAMTNNNCAKVERKEYITKYSFADYVHDKLCFFKARIMVSCMSSILTLNNGMHVNFFNDDIEFDPNTAFNFLFSFDREIFSRRDVTEHITVALNEGFSNADIDVLEQLVYAVNYQAMFDVYKIDPQDLIAIFTPDIAEKINLELPVFFNSLSKQFETLDAYRTEVNNGKISEDLIREIEKLSDILESGLSKISTTVLSACEDLVDYLDAVYIKIEKILDQYISQNSKVTKNDVVEFLYKNSISRYISLYDGIPKESNIRLLLTLTACIGRKYGISESLLADISQACSLNLELIHTFADKPMYLPVPNDNPSQSISILYTIQDNVIDIIAIRKSMLYLDTFEVTDHFLNLAKFLNQGEKIDLQGFHNYLFNIDTVSITQLLDPSFMYDQAKMIINFINDDIKFLASTYPQIPDLSRFLMDERSTSSALASDLSRLWNQEISFTLQNTVSQLYKVQSYKKNIMEKEGLAATGIYLAKNFAGGALAVANPIIGIPMVIANIFGDYKKDKDKNDAVDQFYAEFDRFFEFLRQLCIKIDTATDHLYEDITPKISGVYSDLDQFLSEQEKRVDNFSKQEAINMLFKHRRNSISEMLKDEETKNLGNFICYRMINSTISTPLEKALNELGYTRDETEDQNS